MGRRQVVISAHACWKEIFYKGVDIPPPLRWSVQSRKRALTVRTVSSVPLLPSTGQAEITLVTKLPSAGQAEITLVTKLPSAGQAEITLVTKLPSAGHRQKLPS
jgi:hypothetical protein